MTDAVSHETECFTLNIAAQIGQKRAGTRKAVRHGGTLCSKCLSEPPLPGQRYGRECHKAAVKASRDKKNKELKRLRALAEKQLSKGKDDGQTEGSERGSTPG